MRMYAHTMIRRSISDVFNYLADVRNDVYWRNEIVSAEVISDGPLRVGSIGHHKAKQGGRELDSTWKCTRLDPPLYMEWELISGAYLGSAGYRLKSIDGSTEFILDGTVIINGIARLFSPLMQLIGNRQLQKNAENLKRILESDAA